MLSSSSVHLRKLHSQQFCEVAVLAGQSPVKFTEQSDTAKRILLLAKQVGTELIDSKSRKYPRHGRIDLGFLDDMEFNAWATVYKSRFFIGINTGLLFTLHLIFNRIAADAEMFSDLYGEAHPDAAALPCFPDLCSDYSVIGFEPVEFPLTAERQQLAQELWADALRFIIGHEWVHIANGHLFFKTGDADLKVRREVLSLAEAAQSQETSWERHVIEWDADCCAICQFILPCVETYFDENKIGYIHPLRNPSAPAPDLSGLKMRIRRFLFAMGCVCRLFGNTRDEHYKIDFAQLHTYEYPPWMMRWYGNLLTAFHYLNVSFNLPESDPYLVEVALFIRDEMLQLFQDSERALCLITGETYDARSMAINLNEIFKGDTGPYFKNLNNEWRTNIRPSVEKFAWTQLSA